MHNLICKKRKSSFLIGKGKEKKCHIQQTFVERASHRTRAGTVSAYLDGEVTVHEDAWTSAKERPARGKLPFQLPFTGSCGQSRGHRGAMLRDPGKGGVVGGGLALAGFCARLQCSGFAL